MNFDTERIITEVRLRPALWDLSCEWYKDRDAKIKAWLEVCKAIIQNFDHLSDNEKKVIEKQVQQRWKTARDAYVRCKASLKNTKSGSGGGNKKKYVYFDFMQFLDKKQVVDTEDSMIQNTINESQANSGPATIDTGEGSLANTLSYQNATNDDELTVAPPSTFNQSADTNFQSGRKNVQRKRKRIRDEDGNFEREMLNLFKENTKLFQNDGMSFFCSLLPIVQTFSNHQKLLFRSEVLQKAIEFSSDNRSSEDCSGTSHTYTSTSESQHSDIPTLYSAEQSSEQSTFQSVMIPRQHAYLVEEPASQQFVAPDNSSTPTVMLPEQHAYLVEEPSAQQFVPDNSSTQTVILPEHQAYLVEEPSSQQIVKPDNSSMVEYLTFRKIRKM